MKSGFEKKVSSPRSCHQILKVESSRWITRLPQCEHWNTTQICPYCSTRPQNALDSWAGQKEPGAKHVWGRRKKNKRKENRQEGDNILKVPSLRSWWRSRGMCPLALCGDGCCSTCMCHAVSDWHTATEKWQRLCDRWAQGSSRGLSANPIKALSQEGAVLIALLLFHFTALTIILNEYGGQWSRSPGLGFQWISANRKQEEALMGQRCKNWQKVWQSPEELHISWLILFI